MNPLLPLLRRSLRIMLAIAAEVALVAALVAVGRGSRLALPLSHLGSWWDSTEPADAVVALLRGVALLGAMWLLASTLLYVLASATRVPVALRSVRWATVPIVRRTVDAAFAASLATGVALAPVGAGAAAGADPGAPPVVSIVRDGRSGDLSRLPADATPTTTAPPRPPVLPVLPVSPVAPVTPVAPDSAASEVAVTVAPGDNLWVLAARHVADARGVDVDAIADADVAPYWVRVCEENRARLVSGDPGLVYPGEQAVLPPLS